MCRRQYSTNNTTDLRRVIVLLAPLAFKIALDIQQGVAKGVICVQPRLQLRYVLHVTTHVDAITINRDIFA